MNVTTVIKCLERRKEQLAIVWKMGNYSSLAVKNWGKKFQVIDWVITVSFSGTLLSPSPRVRE